MNGEKEKAPEQAHTGFNPVRYLTKTLSARLLIHGVLLQIGGVIASFVSSAVHKDTDGLQMEAYQKLLTLSWGFSLVSSALELVGWGLVVFACGKVVAEAVREPSQ